MVGIWNSDGFRRILDGIPWIPPDSGWNSDGFHRILDGIPWIPLDSGWNSMDSTGFWMEFPQTY
jgi:hypothetical protein